MERRWLTYLLIAILGTGCATQKGNAQLPLDTAAYAHPIITVTNKHYINQWSQFGIFDTSIVQAGTNLGGAYIKKQGTAQQHKVLINEGGTVFMNGLQIDDCAYLDFIGWGSADPYGFIVNAQNNGFAIPIQGKSHDLQFIGMNVTGGTNEGFTAKIEAADFSGQYLCDTSYAFYVQRRIRISNCKVRNNGGESAYMNSTGWNSRDQVFGNFAPFNGCPIANNNKFDPTDAADTIRNTGTVTNKIFLDTRICALNKAFNFKCAVSRISGTLSGNIILSSSANGTTYTGVQTQALTNTANNTYIFNVSSSTLQYWKIDIVTSGTMLATVKNYSQFYYWPPVSDSIFVDSNVFIAPGRSAVNFSNLTHGYFRGNKGWHIGRELNPDQGKMLANGGKVGYLGDTTYITGNKVFGSFNNNFWTVGEGYIWFENNYGDSAGYYGTTKNSQQTPSNVFGVTVGRTVPVTYRICNNSFYLNSSQPSTQYAIDEGAQVTTNNIIGGNIGTFDQFNIVYSTNCGAVANQPPVCNPGANQTLTLPTNSYFFANASASDPDGTITAYAWTKVSGGTFTIDNASILKPTVSNLQVGTYVFKLTVTDNNGATANKNITIVVNPAPNVKPNVNAGSDIILTLPVNSYAISDASASDPDGSINTYLWQKVSGGTATISNPNILLPTISNLVQGTYLFSLTVTDNGGLTNTDTMQIVVNHALNLPPICYAGNNVVITLPVNSYTFADATASDPDGSIVAYRWTLINGGTYTIDDATILHPTVSNLTAGTYMFRLRVTDDSGVNAQSQVTIVVNNAPNVPPVCNAGNDTTLQLPTNSYQTHATASDGDGTIVSYLWQKFQGGTATISNSAILLPLISNLVPDIYGFSLTVTDNNGATFTDTIFITVLPAPNIPPICNAGGNVIITLPVNSVQTNATASDADGVITSYSWVQTIGNPATISNASIQSPLISGLTQGVYAFRLTVTDNSGANAFSVLTITVNHALNIPPSVNAGVDRTITSPINSVQISGATATDIDGTIVSTVWSQLSGGGYTISNPNALNPLFSNLTQGTYRFILSATDDSSAVSRDTMTITVNHALNVPPIVSAGNDTTIQLPATTINLIGTASDPDGTIVSSLWTNSDGCLIASPSSLSTTATCSTTGTHLFSLTVTDDSSISVFDNKQAIVLPAINVPPTAIASHDTIVYEPIDSLTLTQSGTDIDGTIIGYLTTVYSSNFSPTISNETTTSPVIHGLQQGDTIKVLLRVMDNNNIFGYDTTTIIVRPDTVNHPPVPIIVQIPNTPKPRLPIAQVTLDASQSYDNDAGDYIASYVWTQTSGDNTAILSGDSGQVLTITNLRVGDYTFLLTITDSKGSNATRSVTISVYAAVRVKVGKAKIKQ